MHTDNLFSSVFSVAESNINAYEKKIYLKKPCGVFSLSCDPPHNLAEPTYIQDCLSMSPLM